MEPAGAPPETFVDRSPSTPWILGGALLLGAAVVGSWIDLRDAQRQQTTDPTTVGTDREEDPLRARFAREVVPVLDRRCNACHGLTAEQDAAVGEAEEARTLLRWIVDEAGGLTTPEQLATAYRRLTRPRGFGGAVSRQIDYRNPPLASLIVRAPLAQAYSGYGHHPKVFASPEDPDCRTLLAWVEAEVAARPEGHPPLSESERFFAQRVVPILERKTCFGGNCHGPTAFNDMRLDPGIPALLSATGQRFTPDLHRFNHRAILGQVTRLVHLSGDVRQSKQLLKSIPVAQGGILHKGGNNFLEVGDPDYEVLVEWLELERADAVARTGAALGERDGWVFVRRPRHAPARFFEDTSFHPGGALIWRRSDGSQVDLTAPLAAAGPVDVRAPTVSYDATRVAFAVRRSADTPFDVWEAELATGALRQLTFSRDPQVHYLDPLYVPDPDDHQDGDDGHAVEGLHLDRAALVVVSNQAGGVCQVSPDGALGEADNGVQQAGLPEVEVDDLTQVLDRQLTQRPGTWVGRTLRVLRGTNAGLERTIVTHDAAPGGGGLLTVAPPFPAACDSSTHFLIEDQPRWAPRFDAYRLRLAAPEEEESTFRETLTRMTYSPSQIRRPTMRSSGSIVFTALRTGWQSGLPFFNGALFRTHVDGSDFHTHHGNRSGVPVHCDDRELPSGLEVRVGRDADSWWGGMLILSDHQFGPPIERDNPVDDLDHPYAGGPPPAALHKHIPGWIRLDAACNPSGLSPGGVYRDPYPLPDGSLLVSWAPGPVDLDDPQADPDFDVYRLVPQPAFQSEDGFAAGSWRREPVLGTSQWAEVGARPVTPRLKESVTHATLKLKPDLLGEPGRVRGFDGYPAGTPALLEVYDVPLLELFFAQSTPIGVRRLRDPHGARDVPEVERVRWVRVVGERERRPGETGPPRRFYVDELPLPPDGSLYLALPSGLAFDIQSLNGQRMALRSPNRWLYTQPGERHTLSIPRALFSQTCAGCHGGLTGQPEDVFGRPDVVTSASQALANYDRGAHRKLLPSNWSQVSWQGVDWDAVPAPDLAGSNAAPDPERPPPVALHDVDFERDVRPLLNSRCVRCHDADTAAAGLDLSGPGAFPALRRFTAHREALAVSSYLLEKLSGEELLASRALEGDRPHPSDDPLGPEDLRTLIRWVDLGAGYEGGAAE